MCVFYVCDPRFRKQCPNCENNTNNNITYDYHYGGVHFAYISKKIQTILFLFEGNETWECLFSPIMRNYRLHCITHISAIILILYYLFNFIFAFEIQIAQISKNKSAKKIISIWFKSWRFVLSAGMIIIPFDQLFFELRLN